MGKLTEKELDQKVWDIQEEIYAMYEDSNDSHYEESEIDGILYLSNGKLKFEFFKLAENEDYSQGVWIFKFTLKDNKNGLTDGEWDLLKAYMNMDDDSQPSGTWVCYFSDLWYFQPFYG